MFKGIFYRFIDIRQHVGMIKLINDMLYYREVHLMLTPSVFVTLMEYFGEELLYALIKSERIILHAHEFELGFVNENERAVKGTFHIGIHSHREVTDTHSCLSLYYRTQITEDKSKIKAFADKFSPLIEYYIVDDKIFSSSHDIYFDSDLLSNYARIYALHKNPFLINAHEIRIGAEPAKNGATTGSFHINSTVANLNFDYVNLFLSITSASFETYIAAQYNSEIVTSAINSKLINYRMNDLVRRSTRSTENINRFQENILINTFNLGEAFVNKVIDGKQLLKILEESERFREWLATLPEDDNLINSYVEECSKKTIADTTWAKTLRFILTAGLGFIPVAGNVLGPLASAIDAFVIDKLTKGWKPNLFVNEVMRAQLHKKF